MTTVRFGFLGAGFIATRALAPAVHAAAGAQLYAAAASDVTRATALQPSSHAATDYQALVDDPAVDVIYISLTNDQHLPWILRSLEAGKHVLCEKPLCLTAEETATAFAAAAQYDRLLVEATWYRWHPRTQRAVSLLETGVAGKVEEVVARFAFGGVPSDNYRLQPSRGGGALYDVGCYTVSAALWALQCPILVTAAQFTMGPTQVDLSATVELSDGNGRADLSASINATEAQVLTIAGTEAQLSFDDEAFTSWRTSSHLTITENGVRSIEPFPRVDAYQLMVEAVASRIRGEEAFVIAAAESLSVARVLDRVRETALRVRQS